MVGVATVGRPKKARAKGGKGEAKTIGFRVSADYGDWLERLARQHRTTVSGIIDRALAEWAAAQGHEETPPERMP